MRELITLLCAARRRRFLVRVAHAALASAVATLTALIAVVVVTKWILAVDFGLGLLLVVVVVVLVPSGTLGVVLAVRSTPSVVTLARAADRTYHLDERLGTATEVQLDASKRGLVARALLEDAVERGRIVDPKRLVRMGWPRWTVLAPVLVALLGLAIALPVPAMQAASAPSEPAATAIDLAEAASTLQRVAELLARDRDSERDPYLRAVTEAFADLGQQLAEGTITPEEMERDVGRLLTQLAQALGDRQDPLARLVNEIAQSAGQPAEDPGAVPEAVTAWLNEGTDQEPTPEESPIATVADSGAGALERMKAELERLEDAAAAASSERPRGVGDHPDAGDSSDDYSIVEEGDQSAGARQDGDAAGAPVGAAAEADDGAGDAAGDGIQADSEQSDEGLAMRDFELAEDEFALPWNQGEDGRQIELEVVPDTAVTTDVDSAGRTMMTHRAEESSATHEVVGAAHRDAVSRYFLPSTDPSAQVGP
jgi:hypothetical protein